MAGAKAPAFFLVSVFGTLRAPSGSTGVKGIGMGVAGIYPRQHDLRLR
jgi:hypothetical protein